MRRTLILIALLAQVAAVPARANHGTSAVSCEDSVTTAWVERYGPYPDFMLPVACEMPLQGDVHFGELRWGSATRGSMEVTFSDAEGTRVVRVYCSVAASILRGCHVDGAVLDLRFSRGWLSFTLRSEQPLTASFGIGIPGDTVCWNWEQCITIFSAHGTFSTSISSRHAADVT